MVITRYQEYFREVTRLNRANKRKEYLEGAFTLNADMEEDPLVSKRYQEVILKERTKDLKAQSK